MQNLILRGKRVEAVEQALESKDFALAMMIATFCEDHAIYHVATKKFADEVLRMGSPLHTVAMIFSGRLGSDIYENTAFWDGCSSELLTTWRYHLAAILNNRVAAWNSIVYSLGVRLQDLGDIHAAHVCFMISGCPLSSPMYPECIFALLGCDHYLSDNISFLTNEGLEAFERSEAYEWAKRRGNPDATIKSLQPFKLQYAMLLADLGYVNLAEFYIQSILQNFGWDRDQGRFERDISARLTLAEISFSEDSFYDAVVHFEQRMRRLIPSQLKPDLPVEPAKGKDRLMGSPEPVRAVVEEPPMASPEADMTFLTAKSQSPGTNVNDKTGKEQKKKAKPVVARVKRDFKEKRPEDNAMMMKGKSETAQKSISNMPPTNAAPLSEPPSALSPSHSAKPSADAAPSKGKEGELKSSTKPKVEAAPKSAPPALTSSKLIVCVYLPISGIYSFMIFAKSEPFCLLSFPLFILLCQKQTGPLD